LEAAEASHVSSSTVASDLCAAGSSLGLPVLSDGHKERAWIREEKLETLIPNEPKITTGQVVAHTNGVTAA
jgi:hypothetical protein